MTPTQPQESQVRLAIRLAEHGDFSDRRLMRAVHRALNRSHHHRRHDEARLLHARKLWAEVSGLRRYESIFRRHSREDALRGKLQRREDRIILTLVPFVVRLAQTIVRSPHSVMRLVHVGLEALAEAVLCACRSEGPSLDKDILDVVAFSMFDVMSPRPLPLDRSWQSLEVGGRHRLRRHLDRERLVHAGRYAPDQWFFLEGALTRGVLEHPFPTTRLTEPVYPVRRAGSGRAAVAAVLRVWDTPRPALRPPSPRDLGPSSDSGSMAR